MSFRFGGCFRGASAPEVLAFPVLHHLIWFAFEWMHPKKCCLFSRKKLGFLGDKCGYHHSLTVGCKCIRWACCLVSRLVGTVTGVAHWKIARFCKWTRGRKSRAVLINLGSSAHPLAPLGYRTTDFQFMGWQCAISRKGMKKREGSSSWHHDFHKSKQNDDDEFNFPILNTTIM